MPLSWNEVKKRALEFSNQWEIEANGISIDLYYRPQPFTNELSRLEFLFILYKKYTEPLLKEDKKKRKTK